MTRTQFPVAAGLALAVNKAQGLTIQEGVVNHLNGSKNYRPASKHGLPFVAFTRSESFHMTAFCNLPPWDDLFAGLPIGFATHATRVRGAAGGDAPANHGQMLAAVDGG